MIVPCLNEVEEARYLNYLSSVHLSIPVCSITQRIHYEWNIVVHAFKISMGLVYGYM